ncbi:MAG: transcriptional repressor [Acidimicrobiia bacterium]|nr:transcriptional repressor [Acidimicrobiia bacterium]
MQSVIELVSLLRSGGGRITPQRVAVLEAISGNHSHPTIDEIFAKVSKDQPTLSLKTVYQIVSDLDTLGAINLIDLGMGQLRVDPYVEDDHDHFVCSECKSVYDVLRNEDYINNKISEYGKIDKTEVIYKGICKSCAKRM